MVLHLHNIDEKRKTCVGHEFHGSSLLGGFYLNVCLLIAFIMIIYLCLENDPHLLLGTHQLNCEHKPEVRATETAPRNHLSF